MSGTSSIRRFCGVNGQEGENLKFVKNGGSGRLGGGAGEAKDGWLKEPAVFRVFVDIVSGSPC